MAPVGATGCEGQSTPSKWLTGLAYGYVKSRLRFEGDLDADLQQHALLASVGYRWTPDTSAQASAGSVLSGTLTASGTEHTLQTGFVGSLQLTHQWLEPGKTFLLTSFAFGFSNNDSVAPSGEVAPLMAYDARISAQYGWAVLDGLRPFLLLRAFGGPVAWRESGEDLVGADRDHYALGAGVLWQLDRLGVALSGAALGERGVSLGVSYGL